MSGGKFLLLALSLLFAFALFLPPSVFGGLAEFFNFGTGVFRPASQEDISAIQISARPFKAKGMIVADVYSRYPLNFKSELLVNAGEEDGVKTGGAAVYEGMLVGKVVFVGRANSVVRTVFDPELSLPVRIGKSRADALLLGGVEPRLTMMAKNADVAPGDLVYSASSDLEYGLLVGSMGMPAISGTNVFSEAPLTLSYNLPDIRYISLETK
jgi:cell shape-determining protein MreC